MLAWVILADQVDSRRHNDEVPHLLTALTSPGLLVSPTGYTVGTPQWVLPQSGPLVTKSRRSPPTPPASSTPCGHPVRDHGVSESPMARSTLRCPIPRAQHEDPLIYRHEKQSTSADDVAQQSTSLPTAPMECAGSPKWPRSSSISPDGCAQPPAMSPSSTICL